MILSSAEHHTPLLISLTELDKLQSLKNLTSLALHGNDIEKKKGYRMYVISLLPQLKKLDFSTITKRDRDNAMLWRKLHAPKSLLASASDATVSCGWLFVFRRSYINVLNHIHNSLPQAE